MVVENLGPDTLTSMADLALICRNEGRWEEAEKPRGGSDGDSQAGN
jgi:hypothetical protein